MRGIRLCFARPIGNVSRVTVLGMDSAAQIGQPEPFELIDNGEGLGPIRFQVVQQPTVLIGLIVKFECRQPFRDEWSGEGLRLQACHELEKCFVLLKSAWRCVNGWEWCVKVSPDLRCAVGAHRTVAPH